MRDLYNKTSLKVNFARHRRLKRSVATRDLTKKKRCRAYLIQKWRHLPLRHLVTEAKKKFKAPRQDRTADPWFTRPVL